MATSATPEWLRERNNDPYGTDNKHLFWETVSFERIAAFKVFERDGVTYAYNTRYNAWLHFPTREAAAEHIGTYGATDPWA